MIRDDSSWAISGIKIAIKGALIGCYLSPSYFLYKLIEDRNIIKYEMTYLSLYKPLSGLGFVLKRFVLPSMALGTLATISYAVFTKFFWNRLDWESEKIRMVTGHTVFGFFFGGLMNPRLAKPFGYTGFLIAIGQLVKWDMERLKLPIG